MDGFIKAAIQEKQETTFLQLQSSRSPKNAKLIGGRAKILKFTRIIKATPKIIPNPIPIRLKTTIAQTHQTATTHITQKFFQLLKTIQAQTWETFKKE